MLRSSRLEALFGKRVEELTHADIEAVLHNPAAAEAADLEYKKIVHAKNDEEKDEFCKDAVGLGNDQGGILLIGVGEDKNAVPISTPGVETTDQERRRLTDLLLQTSPHLQVQIKALPDGPGSTQGILLVIVERSPMAPHALLSTREHSHHRHGFLRYPIRNGASTRWMLEPEVATRYRRRFTEARGLRERLDEVEDEARTAYAEFFPTTEAPGGFTHRLRSVLPVLSLALVPEIQGDLRIDEDVYRAFQQDAHSVKNIRGEVWFSQARVGPGRLRAISGGPRSPSTYGEFHTDGSGVLLINLNPSKQQHETVSVRVPLVMMLLLSGLLLLGRHSRDRAGASGTALIHFQLLADIGLVGPPSLGTLPEDEPAPLDVLDLNGFSNGHLAEDALGAASAFVDDLAVEGRELLSTASLLADQAFHAFGLPEVPLITAEGELVPAMWSSIQSAITQWGTQAGLLEM